MKKITEFKTKYPNSWAKLELYCEEWFNKPAEQAINPANYTLLLLFFNHNGIEFSTNRNPEKQLYRYKMHFHDFLIENGKVYYDVHEMYLSMFDNAFAKLETE